MRSQSQKVVGADFNFHIRRQYFQMGAMMSGDAFLSNNNIQAHIGYGMRKETTRTNFAGYAGPTYFNGVRGNAAGLPEFYNGLGAYIAIQAVTKVLYDIGIGIELYDDLSYKQNIIGFRIIAFFSGAYQGEKKNANPNVRSEQIR